MSDPYDKAWDTEVSDRKRALAWINEAEILYQNVLRSGDNAQAGLLAAAIAQAWAVLPE